MTKINKIVMKGFKSFANRTELLFGGDFNCVLGPNGSGKSNVLDALCFVLGKSSSKDLRAEKAANLIYNGGKKKQPAKEGEVSIYFDNASKVFPTVDPYVKITRIIKPSGQSKYRINDKTRTRQQILELLSLAKINPDGYNIILQGDIVRLIEMSSIERRGIIEEIAGISVYEDKKNKALSELEKVDSRLKEAGIILTERKTYLDGLKGDRDQAMKYKNLKDKIDQNKASYLSIQLNKKEADKNDLEKETTENKAKMDKIQKQIDSYKKIIGDNKKEMDEISKIVEERGEKDQIEIHKKVEGLKVDLATNKTRISSCENELARIDARKNQLHSDLTEIDAKVEQLNQEKEDLDKKKKSLMLESERINKNIDVFKKKNKLDDMVDIENKIDGIDKAIEEKQKETHELREQQQNILREKDRLEIQLQSVDEKIKKVIQVEKEHKAQISNLKKKREDFKKATLELNKLLNEDSTLAARLKDARVKLIRNHEELAKLRAKNIGIQEKIQGSVAAKRILEQKGSIRGIYGTVSELGNVSTKYSLALEIAAGPKIKSIVVESDAVAAKCIKYLKDNRLGVAAFIPLNKIKPVEKSHGIDDLKSAGGVHDLALNLISYDPKFSKVFSYVFGNTVVVDDINVARRVGIGNARMVTLDGDLAELSGVMHGGFREKKGRHLGFSEKEVASSIKELEKSIAGDDSLVTALENQRKEIDEKITGLRQEKANLEGEVITLEKSLHLEEGDLDASKKQKSDFGKRSDELDKQLKALLDKISNANSELAKLNSEKQDLKSKISQLRNPTVIAELNTFTQKKDDIRGEIAKSDSDVKGIDTRIQDIFGRDKENIIKILKQNEKEEKDFNGEIVMLNKRIKEQEVDLKKLEQEEKKFYAQFKGLFAKRNKINEVVQKNEDNVLAKTDSIRKIELRLNTLSIESARVRAEMEGMKEEFKQYEGVKILKKPEADLKKEISDFEKMMQNIGNVNMRALEIYDSVEKEYNSLITKKETLLTEKDSVLNMMEEIEDKKKNIFMNTFNSLNEHFQIIFSSITTKGNAYLELESPEKPFEAGLRIKVRLATKKYLDIRSLSGGEKTLTALAFIFSVQEYEPASFYVLDEVDAALDKRNSEKLAKLLKEYSRKAQYLIISHNDAVITEASTLYGVSMNEHGMSKVVSLRI